MKRRALLLDVGWTLVYPARSLWEALADVASAAADAEVPAARCEASLFPLWQVAQAQAISDFRPDTEYPDSDHEFAELFRQLAAVTFAQVGVAGLAGAADELVGRFVRMTGSLDGWRVFAEVPEVLGRLRDEGYVLVVVSNAASGLPGFLEHLGLAGFFDCILASAAEGRKKPDRRLFEAALCRAGVAAGEALHVGDLVLEDIIGPRSAGISAVLIDRGTRSLFPSFRPELPAAAAGTPVIEDLFGLLRLLRDRGG